MLHYAYPRPGSDPVTPASSRDAQIARNLDFPLPEKPQPQPRSEPYVKQYNPGSPNTPESLHSLIEDPLDDVLEESRIRMLEHPIVLPSRMNKTRLPSDMACPPQIKNRSSLGPRRASQPQRPKQVKEKEESDPLACHADNIMRMAMDTTMLGSFYNNSFSSNYSNMDDSMMKRDGLGPSLRLENAPKVEISAEDLEEAINSPFRLN